MPFRLRRPSPATFVALLALVVAMTGTAAAAVLVSSPDQLADEVVTNPKIARNAVTNSRIGDNAINSRTLAPQSVGNAKLGNDSVDAGKIAPRAVGNSELDVGAVATDNLVSPVYSVRLASDGTVKRGVGVASSRKLGRGQYEVTFKRPVANCSIVGQLSEVIPGYVTSLITGPVSGRSDTVKVMTQVAVDTQETGFQYPIHGMTVDGGFDLIVAC
jgi:hypothetical protein